jgi:regulatory protein
MLGRRELSEAQMRQRLARKGHEADAIEDAVARLKSERALDDARVAAAIARTETSIKRRGKLRIKQEMMRAGIASSTAGEAIDVAFSDIDDAALIDAALSKRLRHGKLIADDREFARLYRYLMTQGFESDRVLKLLATRRVKK